MKNQFVIVAFALLVSGCATVPDTITHQPAPTRAPEQVAVPAPAPTNGAIFQGASYRPMFEDRRARLVGDTITIAISERTSAGKSAANTTSKSGSISVAAPSLLGGVFPELGVSAGSNNQFEDKGAASSSNTFAGTITTTVIDVLPNGNMVVSGEKQIALDKGVEYVRFSGIVNPNNITAGNVVASTLVADARVEYRTNSRIDKAEMMSQLSRFFLSLLPL